MAKDKKKLTPAQKRAKKAAKAERQKKVQWAFMNGKQVRVKRPPTIEGVPVDQFILENVDPVWLHQNEMWELLPVEQPCSAVQLPSASAADLDDELPF